MQIVINVTEKTYKSIKHGMRFKDDVETIMEQIENGTPLPKGHGRLIDADTLLSKAKLLYKGYEIALTNTIGDAPTIIEADKETDE